ncbi:MAG: hypothetical protein QM811_13545 [Pirellulales bacterium]
MEGQMLPYGTRELEAEIKRHPEDKHRLQCFVRGCTAWVRQARRGMPHVYCPDHGIRLHASGNKPTHGYSSVHRNCIVAREEFCERIVYHPYKYDPSPERLASENSEDMLSWNVFRSFAEAKLLAELIATLLGEQHAYEPDLYLWGIRVNDGTFAGWHLLDRARQRFESHLPVNRPLTEPDIAIHLPGKYLVLIEAKFTSPNTYYSQGVRKNAQSLTCDELRSIYQDPSHEILDYERAARQPRLFYQLWRNMTFAEWMSRCDHRETRAYHVNLVREGYEQETAAEFATLIRGDYKDRFQQWTWEQLYRWLHRQPSMQRCAEYLETKTAYLRPAFQIKTQHVKT